MPMSVREAFERGSKAFNDHDLDAFGEMLADDVVQTAPGGLRLEGKAAVLEFYGTWFEAFPDAHIEVHATVVTDDALVEEGTFTGTHNGVFHTPQGDIPPTGRTVEGGYVNVLRFRDGTVVSEHLIYDRLELLEDLGLVPAAAAG